MRLTVVSTRAARERIESGVDMFMKVAIGVRKTRAMGKEI